MIVFEPYSQEFHDDPYPVYKALRDEAPVYFHEDLNFYALSRFEDVAKAHQDAATFISAGGVSIEPHEGGGGGALILKDGADHRWHKALITKVFTRERMGAMEPFIRELCGQFIDRISENGEFDFVNDFAVELPLTVISELLGIPVEFRHDIHHFANMMLARGDVDLNEVYQAKLASDRTYAELIDFRRRNPGDDPVTVLMNTELEDDNGDTRLLTDTELAARFMELAIAGHETVSKAIPNGAVALHRFPGERKKLMDDPSLIANAVEEILRFDPPSQLQGRTTSREVELHGITIPEGMKTMLLTGAATHDERKFDAPDQFRVDRPAENSSIYFGYGVHKCLGIHLARLEIRIAFEELFKRLPGYEVYPERSTRPILSNVRGYSSLKARTGLH